MTTGTFHIVKALILLLVMAAEYKSWTPPHWITPQKAEMSRYPGRADLNTRFPALLSAVTLTQTGAKWARDTVGCRQTGEHPYVRSRCHPPHPRRRGRKTCYDALGQLFTYELAVLEGHKLQTSGPYAIVRHPSYTALLASTVGLLVMHFSPGSYLFESGALEQPGLAIMAVAWGLAVANFSRVTLMRIPKEDAVMKREFGKKWEKWAKKTPYRLIPYVY
ncbi:hypothetical protein GSI_05933 [Ganoderma sinense ZZ0214-1]|uniref:Protein-S-isoprenylcysteine O-methyltransferase n=1 Tax=Ganoderma sinense ZZ0214-1 TaxID=1077348 RepID=A0A2G8SBU0_9APHY|nr:hypothetical protein GSI_05933 [Ganoderma sinense ZZ0214-1]